MDTITEPEFDGEFNPWKAVKPRPWYRSRRIVPIVVAVVVAACAGYLFQSAQAAGEAARRSHCLCNLCGITLALHNYHQSNGCLPPAFSPDKDGKPRCSWRVSILPYLEQTQIFNSYNFAVAWDAPENTTTARMRPGNYFCPSRDPSKVKNGYSCFVVVQGPGTMFPGAELVTFTDIKDGLSKTLAIVEVDNVDIPWTSPQDLDIRTMSFVINDRRKGQVGPSSRHPGGVNMGLADGYKPFLMDSTSAAQLKALITIQGGETIDASVIPDR